MPAQIAPPTAPANSVNGRWMIAGTPWIAWPAQAAAIAPM